MLFSYKVKDVFGKSIEGSVEALNQEEAADALFRRGLTIINLKEATFGVVKRKGEPFFIIKSVKLRDLVFSNRQLSMMISAGLPLVEALEISSGQQSNRYLRYVFLKLADEVRGGARFSGALTHYPRIFDSFFINMIKAGEESGKLKEVLNYLADEGEKSYNLKKRLQGAMIYPIFILITVIVVIVVLMVVVLPNLSSVLSEANVALPLPTRIIIAFSNFFIKNYILFTLALALVILILFVLARSKAGRVILDRIIFKLPVVGGLAEMVYLNRFTQSLSTLLVGGLPIITALEITAKVVDNDLYKTLILKTAKEVEAGHSIASVFLKSKDVPKTLSSLIVVGEKTGKLDEVMSRMADFYNREVDRTLANIVSLLEPIIIIFLGIVVAFIAMAVIMPMYSLTASI